MNTFIEMRDKNVLRIVKYRWYYYYLIKVLWVTLSPRSGDVVAEEMQALFLYVMK